MSDADDAEKQAYEERLRRRLEILIKEFDAGNVKIAPGLAIIDSLRAVRKAADGSIDLNTVDGLVRSMALAVEHHHDRREAKAAISLREIQETYFSFLHINFHAFYDLMLSRGLTPHQVALAISKSPDARQELITSLPEFMKTLEDYWDAVGGALHAHVEDMHTALKCAYGGDLFPTHDENIASKCGLYTDTIILPDPFLRSRQIFAHWTEEKSTYYLVKNAMNVLQYRELALAEVDPPIVVIAPDYSELQDAEKSFLTAISEGDCLVHAGKLFGRPFDSMGALMDFAGRLDTIESLVQEIKTPARVLFDLDWGASAEAQITGALKDPMAGFLRTANPGTLVAASAMGRFAQANDLLIKARRLGASPIIDAPTSWQYFSWKLEYDSERSQEENAATADVHVMRALQSLSQTEMQWLGRVPADALIEVRQSGALAEIRTLMAEGIKELNEVNPTNFHRTTDRVFDNLDKALDAHQTQLDRLLAKKWKFAGKDIGTWLAYGTVAVAAAATGYPVYALAVVAADQLIDTPKLKDIPKSIKALAEESRKLKTSPVGLLFSYKKFAERL